MSRWKSLLKFNIRRYFSPQHGSYELLPIFGADPQERDINHADVEPEHQDPPCARRSIWGTRKIRKRALLAGICILAVVAYRLCQNI
jgi:hypothetical protein